MLGEDFGKQGQLGLAPLQPGQPNDAVIMTAIHSKDTSLQEEMLPSGEFNLAIGSRAHRYWLY